MPQAAISTACTGAHAQASCPHTQPTRLLPASTSTSTSTGRPPQVDDPGSSVVVLAQLQDTYHKFQLDLSTKLAREHPELSEQLCEEMMTRQLAGVDKVGRGGTRCREPWQAGWLAGWLAGWITGSQDRSG
jgi:hypothetical protein